MSSEYPPLPSSDPTPNPTEETQKKRTEFWHRLCDAIREHKETPRDPFRSVERMERVREQTRDDE